MRILIVGSNNTHGGQFAPFIVEQANALQAIGCHVQYFGIVGKGLMGYLRAIPAIRRVIRRDHIDVVHAHYGLSGLAACLVSRLVACFASRFTPVVVTYHGSDINNPNARRFSKIAMRLASWNIFVSKRTMAIALEDASCKIQTRSSLIPCGIDLPKPPAECPDISHVLEKDRYHVLFAGAFDNAVKDPELAKAIVTLLNEKQETRNEKQVQLVELKGYSRDEVSSLMYACDAILMTSKTEGSPQVIKEAMACGCPIVSVDVGDVAERTAGLNGCYVAKSREPKELADLLLQGLMFGKRTEGRKLIMEAGLRNEDVVEKLMAIYGDILTKR
ncbi:MAG: glycosyltransferase [Paludibacteraceae bacterium]|nr:glycosyltransferase [Paludibacteraceae bacterium]